MLLLLMLNNLTPFNFLDIVKTIPIQYYSSNLLNRVLNIEDLGVVFSSNLSSIERTNSIPKNF